MTDFVFITGKGLFERGGDGIISRSFFCQNVPYDLSSKLDLASVIWVLVNSGGKLHLQSLLKPELVQRFDEGRMSGWHLISCSHQFGGHLASSDAIVELPKSQQSSISSQMSSLTSIDQSQSDVFKSLHSTLMRRTSLSFVKDFKRKALKDYVLEHRHDLQKLDLLQLELEIRLRFFENELALNVALPLEDDSFRSCAKEVFSFLHGVPLEGFNVESAKGEPNRIRKRSVTTVDCRLRVFTEDDFHARTMVWNPSNYSPEKAQLGLLKTNLAEKRHQEMLKELVLHLRAEGFTPVGSSSIDLAVELEREVHLFEIKSSTEDNYKDQSLKGCGQLAEYAYAFSKQTEKDIIRHVVVERPYSVDLDVGYVRSVCALMGGGLIEFQFGKKWPEKCLIIDSIYRRAS